jgi:hypothetical protein
MDNDYFAQIEMRLDTLSMKVKALEDAVTQIPQINMEADPSRPAVVNVEPAPLNGL